MDTIVELLQNGIEEKRKGNYLNALNYYEQARKINPIDSRSYGNKMKIYIGTEQYELAFRHLLILSHFNILDDSFNKDPMAEMMFYQFLPRFKSVTEKLINNKYFNNSLIFKGLEINPSLNDLIFRADNLTFNMGHCYLAEHKKQYETILSEFGDFYNFFDNYNNSLLGNSTGEIYKGSLVEGYFLCIGFFYAQMNLNFNLNSKLEVLNYYLDPDLKIRKDIWSFENFLLE